MEESAQVTPLQRSKGAGLGRGRERLDGSANVTVAITASVSTAERASLSQHSRYQSQERTVMGAGWVLCPLLGSIIVARR